MTTVDSAAVEAAAYWLVTFLGDGGTLTPAGMYWPLDPPLAHHAWLKATLTDDVEAIIREAVKGGTATELVRDAVRSVIVATHDRPPPLQ